MEAPGGEKEGDFSAPLSLVCWLVFQILSYWVGYSTGEKKRQALFRRDRKASAGTTREKPPSRPEPQKVLGSASCHPNQSLAKSA